MTIAELVSYVKQEAHDLTLSNTVVYSFIDKAIRFMEDRGEYDYQKITEESVSCSTGATTIPLDYNLKRIIEIKDGDDVGLSESLYYISENGVITLYDALEEDKTYYVTYIRYSPAFDGTDANFIVPAYLHRVVGVGAAFFAMAFNNAPEAQSKIQEFIEMLNGQYIAHIMRKSFSYKTSNVKGI